MFFLLSFDLIDRRGLTPTDAGLVILAIHAWRRPAVAAVRRAGGQNRCAYDADRRAARRGARFAAAGAGQTHRLRWACIAPMALLGIAFAVLVTPLTASVMSSVADTDEGLASGVNNAVSRVAQLAGVALSAGVASYASGYQAGLIVAAAFAAAGAVSIAFCCRRLRQARVLGGSRLRLALYGHPRGSGDPALCAKQLDARLRGHERRNLASSG